jgi:hypothetical protein
MPLGGSAIGRDVLGDVMARSRGTSHEHAPRSASGGAGLSGSSVSLNSAACLRSKLAFSMERRWRVEAIKAFRVIHEIGDLNVESLGILAGRLSRIHPHNDIWPQAGGHVYIRRTKHDGAPAPTPRAKGEIVALDSVTPEQFADGTEAILLPAHWRQLIGA